MVWTTWRSLSTVQRPKGLIFFKERWKRSSSQRRDRSASGWCIQMGTESRFKWATCCLGGPAAMDGRGLKLTAQAAARASPDWITSCTLCWHQRTDLGVRRHWACCSATFASKDFASHQPLRVVDAPKTADSIGPRWTPEEGKRSHMADPTVMTKLGIPCVEDEQERARPPRKKPRRNLLLRKVLALKVGESMQEASASFGNDGLEGRPTPEEECHH